MKDDDFESSNKSLPMDTGGSQKEEDTIDDQEMKALKLKLINDIEPADPLYHSKYKWESHSPPLRKLWHKQANPNIGSFNVDKRKRESAKLQHDSL
jgi:hypothetical protein